MSIVTSASENPASPEPSSKLSRPSEPSELAAIAGDTYAVKTELKALGAVWDKTGRIWRIAPDKLVQADAIVEHQALAPAGGGGIDLDTLADPFEAASDGPRYVTLTESDGNVYAAKDALKAIGASWDKGSRAWKVREERAEYARAIVASVTTKPGAAEDAAPPPADKKARRAATTGGRKDHVPHVAETLPSTPPVEGILLGGLWRRRGGDGKVYLSGWLSEGVEIRIVSNEKRADEEEPSHQMYLLPVVPLIPVGE